MCGEWKSGLRAEQRAYGGGRMHRTILLLAFCAVVAVGCARNEPVLPGNAAQDQSGLTQTWSIGEGPYMLWSEATFFINASHDAVDVVPRRAGRFHLNTLKFLESYCSDCLNITGIHNNGDGTIDLTVRITHPFPDNPEFTGFDVKGIVMFQGSHVIPKPLSNMPLYPQQYRLSWRQMGDPELLNADGFTYRWSPWFDSGSDLPMFNYWQGNYANGTPSANVNGFLNFYSDENRHMFEVTEHVDRTYHIALPPGPVEAGYAVEACWEPPTVTPVTDPANDFPYSANQPDFYYFKFVINDGQPITTEDDCCGSGAYEARAEFERWWIYPEGSPDNFWVSVWNDELEWNKGGYATTDNEDGCPIPPEYPDWRCFTDSWEMFALPNGEHQLFASGYYIEIVLPNPPWHAILWPSFDVVDFTVDRN
jgi:hypothetical protein